jgi:hypothetical protein
MGRIEVRKVFELDSFPPVPDIQMPDELGDMIVTYKNQPQGTYKRVSLKPYYITKLMIILKIEITFFE